jgi:hypothetical protein
VHRGIEAGRERLTSQRRREIHQRELSNLVVGRIRPITVVRRIVHAALWLARLCTQRSPIGDPAKVR